MDKYIHDEKNGLLDERLLLFFLRHITQSRNRHAISKPRCSHHSCERHARLVFFRAKQYPAERNFTRFPSGGVSQL